VAFAASVVATGAVAVALAYSEGAWSVTSVPDAGGTSTEPASVPADVTETSATVASPTETAAPSTTATPGATTPDTTTPETTVTAESPADSPGYTDGAYLGTPEYTEWGDVQVQVTISDRAIVDVAAVQYPTDRKSGAINGQALPLLEAEAIALQSADLDIVSGATYTSRTYADSLQAALDQAALAAAPGAGES